MNLYQLLGHLLSSRAAPTDLRRIVLVLPCCIGDVVMATATLQALRRAYPQAHITWAVGGWSKGVVEHHPMLDAVLDTGPDALPVKSVSGFWRFVNQLRGGKFDLAVSLVRSPLMSLAVLLSGVPYRVGLDSNGRGFGYNIRAPIDPKQSRQEGAIYLEAARVLNINVENCWANVPARAADVEVVGKRLSEAGIQPGTYLVMHPGGGRNPGMVMDSKRWPPENFAALGNTLSKRLDAAVVVVGGKGDEALVEAVTRRLQVPYQTFAGNLSMGELTALAKAAQVYIGNDTGMTHLAAAAGARTVMILGPSDPARYAPFVPNALALWKPVTLRAGGVAMAEEEDWNWKRDGIGVEEATGEILTFLHIV